MDILKKTILSIIIALAFSICTPYITHASPLAYSTERIAGQDRVETALKISQKGWDTAQTVILCELNDYPDSIAATPYAVSLNAPILLTGGRSLDPRVVQELQRLSPKNVILLGGSACLQVGIEKELSDKLSLRWERIGGYDRYETSVLLAQKLSSDSLILANGDNFPDALSAATFAGIKQIPIVLTSTKLPDCVIQYYKTKAPQHLIVIGGEAVVPSSELKNNGLTIANRLAGYDRYGTNAAVVSKMKATYQSNDLFLASGITFPDAVAGTVLASKFKAPLLLSEVNDISPSVYTIMREHMKVEPPRAEPPSPDSSNPPLNQGTVTASHGLNLRDTPSSSGKILLTIPNGATITIIERKDQWYKTSYQSQTGWVSAAYVAAASAKGTITAASGLKLRETPSSDGASISVIPQNTQVELTEQQGSWYKTTYQSHTGWISADYVALTSSTEKEPSLPKIDLTPNGRVYILGGTGIISSTAQKIIEGKASSQYKDNLRDFPALPSTLNKPTPPPAEKPNEQTPPPPEKPSGGTTPPAEKPNEQTPPPTVTYDPSSEVLINPFDKVPANALSGKRIMIDPGHGGPDVGAIGPNKTYEKDNNLALGLALAETLRQAGATVILTRETDASPCKSQTYSELEDLRARVNLANQVKPDLFISIHNDANSNQTIQGTSTFYSADNPRQLESQHLASNIQSQVVDTVSTNDRGVKEARFYVLRNTTMPSILLETAFISSPYEEARLQNTTFRKNIAGAVLLGIYNYYIKPLPSY